MNNSGYNQWELNVGIHFDRNSQIGGITGKKRDDKNANRSARSRYCCVNVIFHCLSFRVCKV